MGSSLSRESKLAVSSTPKPEPTQRIKNERLGQLMDPRSPSTDIDRTPIQFGAPSETPKAATNGCALLAEDPRSPTIGITRTPVRDDMRVTVGSFARRLGILFYNEAASVSVAPPGRFSKPSNLDVEEEQATVTEELGSMEPLLACQPPQNFGTMAQHANLLATPVRAPPLSTGDMSPFVLLENVQLEVETEADLTLEEAEEARESPLHKRLSMSLITCLEGAASSQIYAEVHSDSPSPVATVTAAVEQLRVGPDHSYALASFTHDPASPQSPAQLDMPTVTDVSVSSEQLEEAAAQESSPIETEESDTVTETQLAPATSEHQIAPEPQIDPATTDPQIATATPEPTATPEHQISPEPQINPATLEAQATTTTLELQPAVTTVNPPAVVVPTPSPQDQEGQSCKGIRCPNLSTQSPSQVVFKPQWLGKGFGATGLRARGVQARRSKGGSSPLAVRVAVKNVFNDNKGLSTKPKEKGKGLSEGRSPLQLLKETNSPREQSSQRKLKVSTPDRQRRGQLDSRTLAVSLDKENR